MLRFLSAALYTPNGADWAVTDEDVCAAFASRQPEDRWACRLTRRGRPGPIDAAWAVTDGFPRISGRCALADGGGCALESISELTQKHVHSLGPRATPTVCFSLGDCEFTGFRAIRSKWGGGWERAMYPCLTSPYLSWFDLISSPIPSQYDPTRVSRCDFLFKSEDQSLALSPDRVAGGQSPVLSPLGLDRWTVGPLIR